MTHPEHIDPDLARRKCNPDELEIILARNLTLPWSQIGAMTGRSRGVVRRIWGEANRKVNGGYVPRKSSKEERELERLKMLADPDIIRGLRGIPTVGLSKSGAATVPGKPSRSGK